MAAEVATWVALTIAGGVAGNAAYDALKQAARRTFGAPPKPTVEVAIPLQPVDFEQAQTLARAAIGRRCQQIKIAEPDFDRIRTNSYQDATGRWVFSITDATRRKFHVRVPPQRPGDDTATVEVFLTG